MSITRLIPSRRIFGIGATGQAETVSTLNTGITHYWNMDEASGNRADSVGSLTLTDTNTVTSAAGLISTAASFDRNNQEYFNTNSTSLANPGADWTFNCWAYFTNTTSNKEFFSKFESAGNQKSFIFRLGSDERFDLFISSDGLNLDTTVNGTATLSVSTWYMITLEYTSPNGWKAYINGSGTADIDTTGSMYTSTAKTYIGANVDLTSTTWDGLLDEVGFWSRVLTDSERTELYNAGAGKTYPF